MLKYAQVAVPVPLKQEFTYSFDDGVLNVVPGIRVMVPFGRREVQGYRQRAFVWKTRIRTGSLDGALLLFKPW